MDNVLNILRHGLDILLIATAIFLLLRFFKGGRAMNVLYGLIPIAVVIVLAKALQLRAFSELVNSVAEVFVLSIVIIFQPEIRRGLARLGVSPIFQKVFQADREIVDAIVEASYEMASKRTGALIVITRQAGLKAITDHGIRLNSEVTSELILSIFNPYSPLHDGAIVITDNRIVAGGCVLPLSERDHPRELGTRHRAALGITEESDAVAIVVSEERGKVSMAYVGELVRDMAPEQLTRQLSSLMSSIAEE